MKGNNIFWISFSDLMTSMFFIMLVLFVVTVAYLNYLRNATDQQLRKIQELQTSVQELPAKYFEFQPQFKRFKINKEILLPLGKTTINSNDSIYLAEVGESISTLISNLKDDMRFKGFDIKYLIVIEGMASNLGDKYEYDFELSYQRALALYRLWQAKGIIFDPKVCEVQISGSGTDGIREYSGKDEKKNQRIFIHIIPKMGKVFETNE